MCFSLVEDAKTQNCSVQIKLFQPFFSLPNCKKSHDVD